MAQYLVPGVGLVNDAGGGAQILIPGGGLFREDSVAGTTIDLTAASYSWTKNTQQLHLNTSFTSSLLKFLAKDTQNTITIKPTTSTLLLIAQTIQNKLALLLSTPTFTFTPLSISLGTILALGVGTLTFTGWPIDVTGAIATVLRLLALLGVGS